MTPAAGRAASLRIKLFLLLVGPMLVALAAGAGVSPFHWFDEASDPAALAERLNRRLTALLDHAATIAEAALERSPREAWTSIELRRGPLGRRAEGIGLLDGDLDFEVWEGTPADPPADFADPGASDWSVRVEGVRTRLVARAGPDDRGRTVLASFIVDSTLDDLRFDGLLPEDLRHDAMIEVTFGADLPTRSPDAVPLRAPDGAFLGSALITAGSTEGHTRRVRLAGAAWATLLFLALLAFLFDWKAACRGWPGWALVLSVITVARGLLLWQNVAGRLLPRDLGSPSVYGSAELWGLLGSPADLFLTGLMLYLMCLATRLAGDPSNYRESRVVMAFAAVGAASAVAAMSLSLARNSRVPLLDRPAPFDWDARLALWLALLLPALGASELLASIWRARGAERPARPSTVAVALVLVAIAGGASVLLQLHSERLAVEQLRSEYAPQVLDQATRRRISLKSAMQEIVAEPKPEGPASSWDLNGFLAYRAWVSSELFHSRFKSSLDFYTVDGEPISHFGFGLPPLDEAIPFFDELSEDPQFNEEWYDSMAAEPRVLHAEAAVLRDGEPAAIVVGHVLDEPDNLPFLPGSRAYLAALGPGVSPGGGVSGGEPHYVLYDGLGEVSLTTLARPPAQTRELLDAGREGRTVRIRAGGERYTALALGEDDGRMHLLLLDARTPAERLGAIVRLALLGLALLATTGLVTRAARSGSLAGLAPALSGSFYRKLVAALLLASIVPLVGLALFLRGYIERRGDEALTSSATQFVSAAQRVIEDYSDDVIDREVPLTDGILHWLRRIVGQEIHVYRDGTLQATSTRELFDSGLLAPRLDGEVQRRLLDEGLPSFVMTRSIGPSEIPVAYAPVRRPGDPASRLVVAVPLVLTQREIARAISRVGEMILLATVALVGLLAVVAAVLARTVARPVRDLVAATDRIAAGDYATRLEPATKDEVAELVHGFNTMARALGRQRADIERRRDYIETLLRHAPTGVVSLDTEGHVVTINPAAAQLLPTASLRVGADLGGALRASKETEPLADLLGRARSGQPADVDLSGEQPRRVRGVRVDLTNADGVRFGTLILLEDVTELMRSNQLAAWAEMARSIAHEIKNPLTPIQLSAEHLGRLLGDRADGATPEERECLQTIVKQVRALYDIAGEFSAYAKLPALAPEATDPVQFMRGVVSPYRAAKPPGITIDERYDPAPAIAADPRVLSRALINLIENALQAMPDGGKLTLGVSPSAGNGEVWLTVADTGPGLSREVRGRLFEPYFSTKSSGTGLGLAIVRRAVEAHRGTIEVSSEPRRGTTFRIRLPTHAD